MQDRRSITHYDMLGLEKTASIKQIKKAYHNQAKAWHPDKAADWINKDDLIISEEIFKRVGQAYTVLSKEKKREKYDQSSQTTFEDDAIFIEHWTRLKAQLKIKCPELYNKIFPNEKNQVTNDSDQFIKHHGNLTIESDVHEHANITVIDGSLTILGNVNKGAKINVSFSKPFSEALYKRHACVVGTFISAGVVMGNSYIGNVNIDGRILSNDTVTRIGEGRYKITSGSNNPYLDQRTMKHFFDMMGTRPVNIESVDGFATAEIDGIKYQGKEIIVDQNNDIWVDGIKQAKPASEQKNTDSVPTLFIQGNVGDSVIIDSDAFIQIKGKIGHACQITSSVAGISAEDVGEETKINVRGTLSARHIEADCQLISESRIKVVNLKNNIHVCARDGVKVMEHIGHHSQVEVTMGSLKASFIDNGVRIKSWKDVSVGYVGDFASITATMGSFNGLDVGQGTKIKVHDRIELNNVGDDTTLKASMGKIEIKENIGKQAVIEAWDKITINTLGDACELESKMGNIYAKTIGNHCHVKASMGRVEVENIGSNVTIKAGKCITVTGECPDDAKLISKKVKTKKKTQQPSPSDHPSYSHAQTMNREGVFNTKKHYDTIVIGNSITTLFKNN